MIRDAFAALRARRGRTLLAALGVLAASLVVGTSVTVGYSLATGFQRSAEQAQLPDVIEHDVVNSGETEVVFVEVELKP